MLYSGATVRGSEAISAGWGVGGSVSAAEVVTRRVGGAVDALSMPMSLVVAWTTYFVLPRPCRVKHRDLIVYG